MQVTENHCITMYYGFQGSEKEPRSLKNFLQIPKGQLQPEV